MKIDRAMALPQPQPVQVLPRLPHRLGHVRERRPRLALELELDGVGAVVAGLAQDLEHPREVDRARPDRAEVPDALAAHGVLEMDVREVRRDLREIVDCLLAGVELDVRRVVVDLDRVPADLLEERDRDVARGHDVAVDLEGDDDAGALGGVCQFAPVAAPGGALLEAVGGVRVGVPGGFVPRGPPPRRWSAGPPASRGRFAVRPTYSGSPAGSFVLLKYLSSLKALASRRARAT